MARTFLLWITLALVGSSCASLKDHLAQRNHLAQLLYDHTYALPPETVWEAAMAELDSPYETGVQTEEGRTLEFGSGPPDRDGNPTPGMKLVLRAREGGTWLAIFTVPSSAPPVHELDLHSRDVHRELAVMRRLDPERAKELESEARASGRRTRR
jgi:hypothetical protein